MNELAMLAQRLANCLCLWPLICHFATERVSIFHLNKREEFGSPTLSGLSERITIPDRLLRPIASLDAMEDRRSAIRPVLWLLSSVLLH